MKEWLTLPDAAFQLGKILNEPVSEADVLSLALDNKFQLSVRFSEETAAVGGVFESKEGKPCFVPKASEVIYIRGLYDLLMVGCGRNEVERRRRALVGVIEPECVFYSELIYVKNDDGEIFQLQSFSPGEDWFEYVKEIPLSCYQGTAIKNDDHKGDGRHKPNPWGARYLLPECAELVVRSSVLRRFDICDDVGKKTAAGDKKKNRAPAQFVKALEILLLKIEKAAEAKGVKIDRFSLPGRDQDLFELAKKEPGFPIGNSAGTFQNYRKRSRLCGFKTHATKTDFYKKLFEQGAT